jgi:hypothetical protein
MESFHRIQRMVTELRKRAYKQRLFPSEFLKFLAIEYLPNCPEIWSFLKRSPKNK